MPSSTRRWRRSVSTLRAMPRSAWKSSKRRTPRKASRITSSVQRSPRTSSARAMEQFWLSYVRGSTAVRPECSGIELRHATKISMVGCVMQRRWQVLLVTAVAVFMGFLDVTIVNIAFPDIEASFPSASLAGLSWILNAYNIVFAALLVPAGRLADRVGRRRMFLGGLMTFLAASAVCGLAPSVEVLVAARVVQAAGAAALVPPSLALLLPEFPLAQRATATALWGATGAVAAALGPSLGGTLVEATDWRWVFFVNLAIS